MKSLWKLFNTNAAEREAKRYYAELVTTSRAPEIYATFGVPDTLDGRFESIILHLFIEECCLANKGEIDAHWLRLLHEAFFEDMDRSLREGGIGDTGISKRVKRMASAFYGRMQSYHDSWGDDAAFRETLKRNVYATCETPAQDEAVALLANYISHAIRANA